MAKNEERAEAARLRREGWSVSAIALKLEVAKSSVSRWVRHIPVPWKFTPEARDERRAERSARLEEEREKRRLARPERVLSGGRGRWMIRPPEGYTGKVYANGYIYEHRYLMEQRLGRLLKSGEVVHHRNGDILDNRLENLELKTVFDHASHHVKARGVKMVRIRCPACRKIFTRRRGKTHLVGATKATLCSRMCVGRFSAFSDERKAEMVATSILEEYKSETS